MSWITCFKRWMILWIIQVCTADRVNTLEDVKATPGLNDTEHIGDPTVPGCRILRQTWSQASCNGALRYNRGVW